MGTVAGFTPGTDFAPSTEMVRPPAPPAVHQQAMGISVQDAMKLWAYIELDQALVEEYNRHRASLRVRGFRATVGVTWMFDGMEYPQDSETRKGPLRPGERIWVPLIVAQYGVNNTSVWEYETGMDGRIINKQDFLYGQKIPVIRILEIRNPGDFGQQMAGTPIAPLKAPCALCGQEMEPAELSNHMLTEHASELAQAAKRHATGKVAEWADQERARLAKE